MRKHTLRIFVLLLFAFIGGGKAYALSNPLVKADIPFTFTIQGKTFSPGRYEIGRVFEANPSILVLRSEDNSQVADIFASEANVLSKNSAQTDLVFDHIGNRYFLKQIWVAGNEIGREIRESKAEKELRRAGLMPETRLVAALN